MHLIGAWPFFLVMAGLVPAIRVFLARSTKDVDARDKPGHDDHFISCFLNEALRSRRACG